MSAPKYIVVKQAGFEQPIIFSNLITHEDMARNFGGKENVISAGFVSVWGDADGLVHAEAYGNSVSVSRSARDIDTQLIEKRLGLI